MTQVPTLPPLPLGDLPGYYYSGFIKGSIESRDELCPPRDLQYL